MTRLLLLYLPVLFPSWRFFGDIGASPRVQFRAGGQWRDATVRSRSLQGWGMLRQLFWNAEWNEALFLVSLAERLLVEPEDWLATEIAARIQLTHDLPAPPEFRIHLVTSEGTSLAWSEGRNHVA